MNWIFSNRRIAPQDPWSSKLRQYLAFADALGISDERIEFGLRASPAERAAAEARLDGTGRPRVVAFIGSTWPSRFWWPDRTAEVLRRLDTSHGASAVLVGAPREFGFAEEVLRSAPPGTRNLVGETSLRDLVAIFEASDVTFGPDSGPMHLAAAVGKPVVSLWGATSPGRSGPWGSEHRTLAAGVACSPCYLRYCPIDRFCMKEIGVAPVVRALEDSLA